LQTKPRILRPRLHLVVLLLVLSLGGVTPLLAATAQEIYTAALSKERALLAPIDEPVTLDQLRATMRAYNEVVRLYPRSGYSDNALWQVAGLAIETFKRYRQPADKETAVRSLLMLTREYPSSSLLPRAAGLLTQLGPLKQVDAVAQIQAIHREQLTGAVRITIEFDREIRYESELLDGPARLYFDFHSTTATPSLLNATLAFADGDIVRKARLGTHLENTTRVVLDFTDVGRHTVSTLYNPYRLVVDAMPTATEQARRTTSVLSIQKVKPAEVQTDEPILTDLVAQDSAVTTTSQISIAPGATETREPVAFEENRPGIEGATETSPATDEPPVTAVSRSTSVIGAPSSTASGDPDELAWPQMHDILYPSLGTSSLITNAVVAAVVPSDEALKETDELDMVQKMASIASVSTESPFANTGGNLSLARQLGLGVSRVVIDPGHGGSDPGAQTVDLSESALVLDVSHRLAARLETVGIEVVLTRRGDVYLPLHARTELANRVNADLFLSIHANAASNRSASGIETYYLDFASDTEAETLAARENAVSLEGMHNLPQLVQSITMHNKLKESQELADLVQRHLISGVRELHPAAQDLGVKRAPFVVLIGANMPSVLTEISFLSNQEEAAFLATDAYRDRIADALLESILAYQQTLKSSTSFAAANN
jgi:N-acetylmuramoyl-L-alanine amidase